MFLSESQIQDNQYLFSLHQNLNSIGDPRSDPVNVPIREPTKFPNDDPGNIPTEETGRDTYLLASIMISRYQTKEPRTDPVF